MQPLVSCILPTRDRANLIELAIQSYLSQTYPNKELIIVDSGDDNTAMMVPVHPEIRYSKAEGNPSTGMMRNRCCELSNGEFIAHFDSDDWSAPNRLETQLLEMQGVGILTGYRDMLFYDNRDGRCYHWVMATQRFALGTSLFYRRDWWQKNLFEDSFVGEDYKFFQDTLRAVGERVFTPLVGQMMVALIHHGQTSKKNLDSAHYQKISSNELPEAFLALQHR